MKKNMKLYKLVLATLAGASMVACSDIDSVVLEGGTMLASQVQETNVIAPSRAAASFSGMFTSIGEPVKMYDTPDDWGFLMIMFCNDLEGADAIIADSGYNWFSVCGEMSSRNADYRNPYIRYRAPYNLIANVNTFLQSFPDDVEDPSSINMIAQSKALRAFAYMNLLPYYQFNYQIAADKPCVPMVTESFPEDFTNNPRATVKELYELVLSDLDYAVDKLEGSTRTTAMYIDGHVAHGLRARVYLAMGEWAKALADAQAAADGFTPASIAEVSVPSFKDISEHNWIWGYDMTSELPQKGGNSLYATTSSWLRSFSANAYAPACQCYTCINTMLYRKISDTDVRKGWWVDENLESPLLDGLKWPGFDDVANADDGGDAKLPFLPYTNVKFGCNSVGTVNNDEDMPLMRVEEMILIQAECQARLGQTDQAVATLSNFVKTNRDPEYGVNDRNLSLLDEIWFQRRVELWGEGFYVSDMRRLNKPLVRFLGTPESTNIADAFRFNMSADDPWNLLRFPQGEMNTNFGIQDNQGGNQPTPGQNPDLRDGVTD